MSQDSTLYAGSRTKVMRIPLTLHVPLRSREREHIVSEPFHCRVACVPQRTGASDPAQEGPVAGKGFVALSGRFLELREIIEAGYAVR